MPIRTVQCYHSSQIHVLCNFSRSINLESSSSSSSSSSCCCCCCCCEPYKSKSQYSADNITLCSEISLCTIFPSTLEPTLGAERTFTLAAFSQSMRSVVSDMKLLRSVSSSSAVSCWFLTFHSNLKTHFNSQLASKAAA